MSDNVRRACALAAMVLLAGGVLTACTFSVPGGIAAAVVALLVGGGLIVTATTQSGCDRTVQACLSLDSRVVRDGGKDSVGGCLSAPFELGSDVEVGPCLQPKPDIKVGPCLDPKPDINVGPCLSPKLPDIKVGPCLSPPMPDLNVKPPVDAKVGPCLSPKLPDLNLKPPLDAKVGPCLSPPKPSDAKVGPCLSPPPPPESAELLPGTDGVDPLAQQRAEIVARLKDRLPADLAARLDDDHSRG